jgi:hypothetical protein
VCDVIISDAIEDPLPKTSFFGAVIGSAGSGKTSLVVNILTMEGGYKKCFDHVHLICPKNSMGSLKDDIWKNHPADKIHNTLDGMVLKTLHDLCLKRAATKPRAEFTLVVIDDMAIWLKQKDIEAKLREMVFNRRHLRLSFLVLVQSYNTMPLTLRKTLSHFFLFKPRNKKEVEIIWEELMFVSKKTGAQLLKYTYQDQHDFLMGESSTGRFFRNFDEIGMPDDDDLNGMMQSETHRIDSESSGDSDVEK